VKRTVGQSALKEIRGIVDEEQRAEAGNERFLRAFVKYGWIIMLLVSLALAHLLGAF
jgi:cation transport ATPase